MSAMDCSSSTDSPSFTHAATYAIITAKNAIDPKTKMISSMGLPRVVAPDHPKHMEATHVYVKAAFVFAATSIRVV
jgi:hypothetical protein